MNHFYRTILAICCLVFLAFRPPAVAQQKKEDKVTINIRNGTLEEIIQAVRKQTAVKIVYNQEVLRKNTTRLSFTAKDEPLKVLMKRLLKGSSLIFVMQDDVMVIAPREEGDEDAKINNTIKGIVKDEKGNPLMLVTVNVSGTPMNIITNNEGKFSIVVEEGKTLTFSSVGYLRRTIKPMPGETMAVTLQAELNEMEEVVVTGYQEISKRLSASSTVTLKGADIKEAGSTNIVSMLQGKVAGLSVVKNSGSPNAIPSMRMRGTSTLIGNANPIIVVDGIVRENPSSLNPDNLLGPNPDARDLYLMKEGILGKGSLTGNSITGLNINDVESINFLKDASATAIYGTRAANGVIVITTKKGKGGRLEMNYSSSYGTSLRPGYGQLELMNSQQRVRFSREMFEDGYVYKNLPVKMGYEGALMDLLNKKITEAEFQKEVADLEKMNTDWFRLLFRNSFNLGQHVSFSGGGEKTSYYASVAYNENKGAAKLDNLKEGSASVTMSSELSRKLKVGLNLSGSQRGSTGYFGVNPLDYALSTSRTISAGLVYPVAFDILPGISGDPLDYNFQNEANQTGNQIKDTKLNVSVDLSYLLMRGLKLTSLAGGSVASLNSEQYATELSYNVASRRGYNYGSVAPGSIEEQSSILPFGGIYLPSTSSMYNYTFRNMAEFNRSIFTENHQVNIVAGHEMRSVRESGLNNLIPGYFRDRGESFSVLNNSLALLSPKKTNTLNNSMSLFGTATYSYAGKYILNGNIRTDASNRFGQYANQRFLPVWSLAGRWNLSSEKWLQNNRFVNDLNIKASYGFQGNVITSVGPELILYVPEGAAAFNSAANEFLLGIKSMPYPDLRWEKTKSINIEFGGSLFNSFVNFNLGYYRKSTTDAIVSKFIPVEYGIDRMLVNGGNIRNYGYEMDLGFNLVRKRDLNWRLSVNGSRNINQLQKGTIDNVSINLYDYFNGTALVEGKPINTIYVFSFKGLDPKTGVPLFYGVDDEEKDPEATFVDHLKPAGSRDAKISGGLNTNVSYKAFSLTMNFSYKIGSVKMKNPVYNSSDVYIPMPEANMPAILEQRWRKPGDEAFTNIPAFPKNTGISGGGYAISPSGNTNMNRYEMYNYSDVNVVSGTFLRCNNLDFSYRIADGLTRRLKLKRASVSVSASNLFVLADKRLKGQDPEIEGVGTTALPITKIFTLGLNVTF
ncbi:SusC/RagA family TonB-linked outer membrane protein [Pedobacter africanus]|uniref:TonB-linked outer membrane protein, SusC/RagA family n=1 Tax=Pedobacter africanus TaxID=151894 RepID=A0A1W2E6F2_9SPHI|nr:SusC/RagA family TonB-linked outer membrane protein [Pedobacter africanus]SMD05350.1 TonB-linked outer membrane protein, SusC/RagA family [Pedobacter africanus]